MPDAPCHSCRRDLWWMRRDSNVKILASWSRRTVEHDPEPSDVTGYGIRDAAVTGLPWGGRRTTEVRDTGNPGMTQRCGLRRICIGGY